jgi:hypothetical protein
MIEHLHCFFLIRDIVVLFTFLLFYIVFIRYFYFYHMRKWLPGNCPYLDMYVCTNPLPIYGLSNTTNLGTNSQKRVSSIRNCLLQLAVLQSKNLL